MTNTVNLANVLLSLSDAIDLANPSVSQHQLRTTYIACEIGKQAGLSPSLLEKLFIAALFHDIGAITVEEKIALFDIENVNVLPQPARRTTDAAHSLVHPCRRDCWHSSQRMARMG